MDKIYDLLLQMGAAGLSQWIFLDERTHAGRMALIILGMCQISLPFGMNLGLLTAWISGRGRAYGLMRGIGADISGITGLPLTGPLRLGAWAKKRIFPICLYPCLPE